MSARHDETTKTHRRRGYSLTVVLIFLILMFALWSTVFRSTSSLLRIETNRVLQQSRDQGAMNALAQAIQLLQYATPSDSSNPNRNTFIYGVTVTIQNSDRRLRIGQLHRAVQSGAAAGNQLLASAGRARNLQRSASDSGGRSPVALSDSQIPWN